MTTQIHCCIGDPTECESPAVCERCGHHATPEAPVLVSAPKDGEVFEFLCDKCQVSQG